MSLKKQVVGGLKWKTVLILGRQLFSLLIFTTLTRILGPSEFGLMGLTFIYLTLVGFLADQGLGSAIIQRADLQPAHLHSAFWFSLGTAFLLWLSTVLLADSVARLFDEPRLAPLLGWASLSLIFSSTVAVQNALFTRDLEFRRPAIRSLVAQAVGGAIGISMALSGWGVWSLVGQQLGASLTGAITMATMSSYRPALHFSLPHLRDLLRVSFPLVINWVMALFSSRVDQIIIGRVLTSSALGVYVVSGRMPELVRQSTVQAISEVSMPALSKMQQNHSRMREAIYHGMRLNALVMFPVFIGLAATASDLVPLLFGAKWSNASLVTSLLSIYALIQALQDLKYPAFVAAGITGRYLVLNTAATIVKLVACLIGAQFGLPEVVLGLILASLVMVAPGVAVLRSQIGLQIRALLQPCAVPAAAALVMFGATWIVAFLMSRPDPSWARLTTQVAIGAAVYLAITYRFNRTTLLELYRTVSDTLFGDKPKLIKTETEHKSAQSHGGSA